MKDPGIAAAPDWSTRFRSFIEARELRIATDPDTGEALGYRQRVVQGLPGREPAWIAASGKATLHSFTVYHITYAEEFAAPYNVAEVALEEGPILVSTVMKPGGGGDLVACLRDDLVIGMGLRAHFRADGKLVFVK
ncbi:MAG TPA: OB-fold domain-containing protein [Ramlibacter sp.]|uniref:Zn-ribbon domain-containing OB-fold protein n=1 Tax=Ramlibacter sp. TaxID=1917967 RepID=UPI002BB46958|nr:OB-fold domain-containing protein [Ramlibacter sp.]HVZ46486.1 OB-fold domain-containing protein [Ramlibacter sp.]